MPSSMNRREFTARCAGLCATALVFPVLPALGAAKEFPVNLADHPELAKVGGFKAFEIEKTPVILMRTGPAQFRALSLVCRHKGCTVAWSPKAGDFECPCHGSRYDAEGKVVNGPAKDPLAPWKAAYNAGAQQVILTPAA